MEISSAWIVSHLRIVLATLVIPVLAFLIFIGVRLGRGYYTAGLDALAGLVSVDLGLYGAVEEFEGLLSGPFHRLEGLIFVSLGLLGIVFFTFLSPLEGILVEHS